MTSLEIGVDAFFSLMADQGGVIVRDTPRFDLDSYLLNYKGRTRFDRLFQIGRRCVPLCVEALKAAVVEAKKGKDVHRYKKVWSFLRVAAPDEPEALIDPDWIERTEESNLAETKRLERELKTYKNNLVKDSILLGHEELGAHLEAIGNLEGALEAYSRMRPDVSTPKQIIDVGKHLVDVSVQRRDWGAVAGHLSKVPGLQGTGEEKRFQPYLLAMTGLACMGQKKYLNAAKNFLSIDYAAAPTGVFCDFLSPNDIAVYGGLLALTTMNRDELQAKVLDNSKFRTFLELEPHLRRAISQFVGGRYAACLAILDSYRADYTLDLFFQQHVDAIYTSIRSKCITQYLIPFSCVTMENMNASFSQPGGSVEEELTSMIRGGVVNARIDTINKLVTTVRVNPRFKMQQDGLETMLQFEREAIDRIRRMGLVAAGLEVKGSRKTHPGLPELGENWYEPAVMGDLMD